MPGNIEGFFMFRSYQPFEFHADYFVFERIAPVKPAIDVFFSSRRRHTRLQGYWSSDVCSSDLRGTLAKYGEVPLPPYIRRPPRADDRERYQTVYAAHDGSVAAPTAGLHFTLELLARLRAKGVAVAELDLHVGPGTFKPVQVDDVRRHRMDLEAYVV